MIITMPLLLAGMQIGGGLASKLLEKDNPKLARNIQTLIGSFATGAQGMTDLAGAFASPKIGSELSKSTVEGLSKSDGGILPRIVGMGKGGDLGKQSIFSGVGNPMQIGSSGILDSADKVIPTLHNPFDLL